MISVSLLLTSRIGGGRDGRRARKPSFLILPRLSPSLRFVWLELLCCTQFLIEVFLYLAAEIELSVSLPGIFYFSRDREPECLLKILLTSGRLTEY